jgi:hypothetical protein
MARRHNRERLASNTVDRTHLTKGMLAAPMDSRFEQPKLHATPHLDIAYQPRDFRALREMRESWKIITEDQPQPSGINPGGPRPSK